MKTPCVYLCVLACTLVCGCASLANKGKSPKVSFENVWQEKAHDYMLTDSAAVALFRHHLQDYTVSKQIIFIDYASFSMAIVQREVEPPHSFSDIRRLPRYDVVRDSLAEVDSIRLAHVRAESRSEISRTSRKARFVIFFSSPYENTLAAELIMDEEGVKTYGEIISSSTVGFQYLFIFNEGDDIEEVYSSKIIYN